MIALWDLGNVVIRWEPETVLEMFGLNQEQTNYLRDGLLGHPDWLALDRGVTTEAAVAERLVNESDLSMQQVLRCFDLVRESMIDLPLSLDVLHRMKAAGIPMYVLSNMPSANAAYLRKRDYFKLFDGVVVSCEEKLLKPEPAIFELVLQRFKLNAADVYFIDDSLPNIDAARSLGLQAQHFHRTDQCYATLHQAFSL